MEDKQNNPQKQISAQSWLRQLLFERAKSQGQGVRNSCLDEHLRAFRQQLKLAEQLEERKWCSETD